MVSTFTRYDTDSILVYDILRLDLSFLDVGSLTPLF